MNTRLTALASLAAVLTGCTSTPEPTTAVVDVAGILAFDVELATTPDQQRDGLSGRHDLSVGTGMLFQFDGSAQREVWMAGMEIPVDAAWIAGDQVIAVDTLDPCTTTDQAQCPRSTSPGPADALLEVPAGSLETITPGTSITVREEERK